MGSAELAAGGRNIPPFATPDHDGVVPGNQNVLKFYYGFFGRGFKGASVIGVVGNQIDFGSNRFEQSGQRLRRFRGIVDAFYEDILDGNFFSIF